MNTKPHKNPQYRTVISRMQTLLAFFLSLAMHAQQATPSPKDGVANDEVIELSPFEVRTDKDTSYGAVNSTSLTRFNTELDNVAITADIFTETFMQDVDALSVESMFQNYGAGAGALMPSMSGDADQNQPGDRQTFGDRFNAAPFSVRGLSAGYPKRDGFAADSTNTNRSDIWDLTRVEVIRGPQGLLYGAGGAGGTVTYTSKPAQFGKRSTRYMTTLRVDEYGSLRMMFDANFGARTVAVRVVGVNDITKLYRTNLGDNTLGGYVQVAFKLPFNSTLRIQGRFTRNERWVSNVPKVNFGGTANDQRDLLNIGYLLATGQTGAINPKTGEPYEHVDETTGEFVASGPIANGKLTWKNYASYFGNAYTGRTNNAMGQITLDTVWTKWLSTSIGANTTKNKEFNRLEGSNLYAPGVGGNPFSDDWAVNSSMYDTVNWRKREMLRASALTEFNIRKVANIKTAAGYDYDWLGTGQTDYSYFLSDPNGVVIDRGGSANLGRTTMSDFWWKVSDVPVRSPLPSLGTPIILGQDGQYYARAEKSPKRAEWVTPDNPFGTAQKAPSVTGLPSGSNINASDYQWNRTSVDGFWAANYTAWLDDRFNTMIGARRTITHQPIVASDVGNMPTQANNSINIGINVRITSWLRAYYGNSSTYDNAVGFNDPLGNQAPTSSGRGQEIGLKFSPFGRKLSGSLGYYWSKATKLNTLFNNIRQQINPDGLNGRYLGANGQGTNQWVPLDQESSGLELILTSQITKNWFMRLSATRSDGRIKETKSYQIVYNDQFWVKDENGVMGTGRGKVVYSDGQPFMVPIDPAGFATLSRKTDQSSAFAKYDPSQMTQLTTDMMSDPNSDYYAWGKGNSPNTTGQINTGFQGTQVSLVGNLLRYLVTGDASANTGVNGVPIAEMQYDWAGLYDGSATIMAARKDDYTVGYPVYRLSLTSNYQFSEGWLRGFGFVISVNNAWQWRTTYYNDNAAGTRNLYSQPELGWTVNLNPFYRRKFRWFTWRTQLNISNVFDRYVISVMPNNGTAWSVESNLRFRWDGQPRAISWTNTFEF